MPRILRTVASGHPYYVRQRGNDRQAVFPNDSDAKAHEDRAATAEEVGSSGRCAGHWTSHTRVAEGKTKKDVTKQCLFLYHEGSNGCKGQ
jgi:hypothetical protein